MLDNLLNHIERYILLNAEEKEILRSFLKYKKVQKKELLLKQNQICSANHFILSGCFRLYIAPETGLEKIIHFAIPNWWICDYQSYENKTPSEYCIQAIEESEVLILERALQDELFGKVPAMERYFRIILQRAFAASLKRIQLMYSFTGEERYYNFIRTFPEFVQRVPQYMLASYLGLTPEFISMIRAKKKPDFLK